MYDGTWHVSNIVHDVYYNHIWHIVGRRITQNGLLRQLPGWNWTFKSGSPAKCNDENYQHVVRHYCWQVWWSRHIISTQNFSKFVSTKNRPRLIKVKDNLDFNDFFRWSGGRPNGFFLESSGIWCNLSIMFLEFILSNNSSFEPQHYCEDSYIPIFALICTLKL